ncbi:hypothetical protein CPB84DRAFT_1672635 [Gymnopilus junonius]|uniref:Uncharacterized protein n=1 Tax=Gymnopilus junonius TaxID=109634 RepID=A0A9P5NXP6_GYMJU|nr:hypothetical protein CPB84DRAFT_1672635 [Gymnopilus junonius]
MFASLLQTNWNPHSRHTFLYWVNAMTDSGRTTVHQIIQLEQLTTREYVYNPNLVIKRQSTESRMNNEQYYLGDLTHEQRQRVLYLAQRIPFNPWSQVNGCQVWLRDLLQCMLNEHIITQAVFNWVCQDIPLYERQPEH